MTVSLLVKIFLWSLYGFATTAVIFDNPNAGYKK